jgi:predicted nucleic-acid-binding Zn-ribbon protein
MRKRKVCPKCNHDKVLLIAQVPDSADYNQIQPLHIATVVTGKKTFMGDDKIGAAGTISAAVCRSCGFAELYVNEPASLQVDGRYVREA